MRSVLAVAAAVFAVAVSTSSPVSAQQTTLPTLTPTPPGFLTCKAIGSGTICRGARTYSYGAVDTGIACGTGSSAFDIFDEAVVDESATWFYRAGGNLDRVLLREHYRSGRWSDPAAGTSVGYRQIADATEVLSTPGDFDTATITETGQVHIRLATGAPLLIATGRQVYTAAGDLLSSSGRNAFVAAFFDNDVHAFDEVCAALA